MYIFLGEGCVIFIFFEQAKIGYIKHNKKLPPQYKVYREEAKSSNTQHN